MPANSFCQIEQLNNKDINTTGRKESDYECSNRRTGGDHVGRAGVGPGSSGLQRAFEQTRRRGYERGGLVHYTNGWFIARRYLSFEP